MVDVGLHAQREPGVAGVGDRGEQGRRRRLRVGLGGDLRTGRQPERRPHRVQHRDQPVGAEQRGRPAAEEHRVGPRRRAEHARRQVQLAPQALQPRGGRGGVVGGRRRQPQVGGGVGVEVAVAAAGRAERHVDVDAERARAEPVECGGGQHAVGRGGLAAGGHGGHASIVPAARVRAFPCSGTGRTHEAAEREAPQPVESRPSAWHCWSRAFPGPDARRSTPRRPRARRQRTVPGLLSSAADRPHPRAPPPRPSAGVRVAAGRTRASAPRRTHHR